MEKRYSFLDLLRVSSIGAVVLIHTITGVLDTRDMTMYPAQKMVFLILMDWITWCVPVFLMISGYLFLNKEREVTPKKVYLKSCRRLLLALFLFGVPFAWLEILAVEKTVSFDMIFRGIASVFVGKSWAHLWYIYLILLMYIFTPVIRVILHKMPMWSIAVVLVGLSVCCSIIPFIRNLRGMSDMWFAWDFGIYFFYYLLGYVFSLKKTEDDQSKRRNRWNIGLGVVIILVLLATMVGRVAGIFTVQMAYNYPTTMALSILIMALANNNEPVMKRKSTNSMQKLGDLCFTVYLIHPVFLNFLYKFLDVTPLRFYIGISLPLFWLVVVVLSFGVAYFLYQIPILKKYVL